MTAFLLPLWSFTQDTVELSKSYERLRFWQFRAKTLEEKQLCMCFFVCFVSLSCCCCYANNIVTSLCFCKISNTHLTTLNLLMHLLHSHVNWTGTICSQEMPRYNSFSGGKRKNGTNWPHRVHLATSKGWWVHFQLDANDCLSTLFTFQGRRQQVTIYFCLE